MYLFIVFLELLNSYFAGIRNLFIVSEQYFFADNFGNKKTGGFVGKSIFFKKRGGGGQQLFDAAHQVIEIEFMLGRYRYYFGVGQTVFPFFYEVFE